MKFDQRGRRDDIWFAIVLLVPAFFAGARYCESERQMDQIARAGQQKNLIAAAGPEQYLTSRCRPNRSSDCRGQVSSQP